jgi:hypothetical protein
MTNCAFEFGDNPETLTTIKKATREQDALLAKSPIGNRYSELVTMREKVWFAVPYIDPYRGTSAKEPVTVVENIFESFIHQADVAQEKVKRGNSKLQSSDILGEDFDVEG